VDFLAVVLGVLFFVGLLATIEGVDRI